MKKIISFLALLLLTVAGMAQTGQRFTIEVSAAAASVDSNLFIKNQIATVESKMSNYRSARMDSLFIRGAAQYLWNRAADYTSRSFTDKGYVDSVASLYLILTDTADAFSAYLRKGDFKILSALDLDSSNISDDDLMYYDSSNSR